MSPATAGSMRSASRHNRPDVRPSAAPLRHPRATPRRGPITSGHSRLTEADGESPYQRLRTLLRDRLPSDPWFGVR